MAVAGLSPCHVECRQFACYKCHNWLNKQEYERRTYLIGDGDEERAMPGTAHKLREIRKKKLKAVREEISKLDEEIYALREKRNLLVRERKRLYQQVTYVPSSAGVGDGIFVPAIELKPHIEEFCELHGRGAVQMLAERANINQKTISRIRHQEYKTVALNIADQIMLALGKQELVEEMSFYRNGAPGKPKVKLDDVFEIQKKMEEESDTMPY